MLPNSIRMQSSIVVLALLMLGGISSVIAQVDITGSITDGVTGEPLIGATIIQKGTTNGTNAGVDGATTLSGGMIRMIDRGRGHFKTAFLLQMLELDKGKCS